MLIVLFLFVFCPPTDGFFDKFYLPNTGKRDWAKRKKPVIVRNRERNLAEVWTIARLGQQISNMTFEIIRDCDLKMRYLEALQEVYKKDAGFTLGEIAATVMEKYAHMVQLYKFYEGEEVWSKDDSETMSTILSAYQSMISDYNELKVEKNVYDGIVKEYEKKKKQGKAMLREPPSTEPPPDMFPNNLRMGGYEYEHMPNRRFVSHAEADKAAQEEYKKTIRHLKWMEKWKGFNPEIEGVDIGNDLTRAGLENASSFLRFNPF